MGLNRTESPATGFRSCVRASRGRDKQSRARLLKVRLIHYVGRHSSVSIVDFDVKPITNACTCEVLLGGGGGHSVTWCMVPLPGMSMISAILCSFTRFSFHVFPYSLFRCLPYSKGARLWSPGGGPKFRLKQKQTRVFVFESSFNPQTRVFVFGTNTRVRKCGRAAITGHRQPTAANFQSDQRL